MEKKLNWLKEHKKRLLFCIFLFIPFLLGSIGMLAMGEGSLRECAYKSLQLYTLEFSVESYPLHPLVEIARWMAPIMTVATIITTVSSFFESVFIWLKIRIKKDTIVVHGDSDDIATLMKNIGKKGIRSEKPVARLANRHILMFKEDYDMYRFMNENMEGLLSDPEKKFYLCSEKISRGSYEQSRIVACNIAENCARGYWKKYPLKKQDERICIVGFGNYGQRLLTQAILTNVYSLHSQIEYHVAGDYHEYLMKHYKMDRAIRMVRVALDGTQTPLGVAPAGNIRDVVYFYDGDWYDMLAQKSGFDRVILVYDEDAKNIEILNELKTYYINTQYHVKLSDDRLVEMLWRVGKSDEPAGNYDIFTFGTNDELYDLDVILNDQLFYQAKMIHAYYYDHDLHKRKTQSAASLDLPDENENSSCENDNSSCENDNSSYENEESSYEDEDSPEKYFGDPDFEKSWADLSSFMRYSNVAAADHIPVKLHILEEYLLAQKEKEAKRALSEKDKEAEYALTEEDKQARYALIEEEKKEIRSILTDQERANFYAQLDAETQKIMWHIEHVRWCRYHFMNNWDFCETRDDSRRLHNCLRPFAELQEKDKEKNRDIYKALRKLV